MSSIGDTENEEIPAWRMDPEESYSDWIIEVIGKDSGSKAVYHVHKLALAIGPRKSDYFAGVFRHTSELSESTKSTLTLEDSAAAVFPNFLDYIYTGKLDLKIENDIELHHLSNYFGVSSLNPLTQDFLLGQILKVNTNILGYLPRIFVFRDKLLMEHAVLLCADLVLCSDDINPTFDYGFLLETVKLCSDVVRCRDLFEETTDSGDISYLVLDWMKANRESLDAEKFTTLVDEDMLPTIGSLDALEFLELENEILGRTSEAADVSSLQKRCISAITSNDMPFNLTKEGQNKLTGLINAYSKATVVDLLLSCMVANKKRKHRHEYDGEHHIVVKGSSNSSMNGVWKKKVRAEMPDEVKYHKHGAWKGESCEFVILEDEDGELWHIAVKSGRNDGVFEKLYFAHGKVGSKIPPAWGWLPKDPARGYPLLFFCPDGNTEDDE